MGGLGGHVDHLYDNPDLTFTDMIKMMTAASNGEITGGEKLDGQNLFVSYSVKDGKAKAARNVGNVKKGGMDAEALAAKFAGRGTLEAAFNGAFDSFVDAVSQMSTETKVKIFGQDANIFYNAEVMDPDNPNIINYNSKKLIIHQDGHGEYDRESGAVTDRDVSTEASLLRGALQKISTGDQKNKFGVEMKAIERLRALSNDSALNTAVSKINNLLSSSNVSSSSTVGEYIIGRLDSLIEKLFPSLDEETKKMVMQRMFGVKGVTATQIYKRIESQEIKNSVRDFIKDQKRVRREIIYPLEDIIHDFAVAMLDGLKSRFVVSHKDEINRISDRLESAIAEIEATGDEQKIEKLKFQLGKLKSLDKISSSMEGFVFAWNGHTYKLTGSFAPINQIMGMLPKRFTRGEVNENEEMNSGKVFGIFPGKFKPPHAGHLLGASEMVDSYDADIVYIIISKKDIIRQSGGNKIKITPEVSKMIWDTYINENGYKGKIIAQISKAPSPIVDTFDMLSSMPSGSTVLFSKGEKDMEDRRFSDVNSWIEKKSLDIKVQQVPGSMSDTKASGTALGNAIVEDDLKTFKSMVPLSGASAMSLWEYLTDMVVPDSFKYDDEEVNESIVWKLIDEALTIDSENVPDGQLGGPQSIGDKNSAEPEVVSVQPQSSKGGESTEVEIITKTVVSVDVNGPNVKVSNKVESENEPVQQEEDDVEKESEEVVTEYAENETERGIINLDYGLQLARQELPQIKSTDVSDFIDWLSMKNVDSFKTSIEVDQLSPIQREINLDKVSSMISKHESGDIDLSKGKPVMVSADEHLMDGHHRWYALKEMDPDNKIDIILIDLPIKDLIQLTKEFPKTSFKGATDESLIEEQSYGKISDGGASVVNVGKMKIVIDVEDMDLKPSKHGEERRFRHGQGKTISKDSILQAAERGLGLVIQDYANGELANGEAFVIRHKANKNTPALNLVGALEMKKGPDTMKIITVMRKDDFKTDNFGGGQQKTYNI